MARKGNPNLPAKAKGSRKPPHPQSDRPPSAQWWLSAEDKMAGDVFALVKDFARNQSQRLSQLVRWFRLYNNSPARGILPGNYYRTDYGVARQNRLTLNVVKSCIDTVHAKIGKNRVRALFLTDEGQWSDQQKAKQLQKFTDGLFYQTDFYRIYAEVFRDAAIFGTGIVKIIEDDDGRVCYERGFVDEFFVDEVEAAYTRYPRSLYQRRAIPREVLLGLFPETRDPRHQMILDAPVAKPDNVTRSFAAQADLIEVTEAWHLPSSRPGDLDQKKLADWRKAIREAGDDPTSASRDAIEERRAYYLENSKDGRHVFSIETGVLDLCGWRRMRFPIETLHWTAPVRGFLNGIGISEELMGIQYEINKILRKIQDSIDWCVPKMLVPKGSKVVHSHLDDVAGGIIEYYGSQPPKIEVANAVSPELFNQLDRLLRQAYEIVGVSELSAQSKKPAGLESGAALREFSDIESERFVMAGRAGEDFTLACAEQGIELAREIAERDGDYEVQAPIRSRAMQPIRWAEIDMKRDAYILQAFPTSSLPRRPEGKIQFAMDLANLNLVDREDLLRLLDFPDVSAVNDLSEASADYVAWQIEKMVDSGEMVMPEPMQNLKYAMGKAQAAFMRVQMLQGTNQNAEKALLNFIKGCAKLLAPPPMPVPGMPGMPPGLGAPMPGAAGAGAPPGAFPGGVPGPSVGAPPGAPGPAPIPQPAPPL